MENLAEWLNAISITEGLNKVENKNYANHDKERTADHIGKNVLWEKNAEQSQKLVEEQQYEPRRVWTIGYKCCLRKTAKEIKG